MGVHTDIPPQSPEPIDTDRKQNYLRKQMDSFIGHDPNSKYAEVADVFDKQIDSCQSRIFDLISQMEAQLGDKFNEKIWISSADKMLSEELEKFSLGIRDLKEQEDQDVLSLLQDSNLDLRLSVAEKEIAEMLSKQKKYTENAGISGLNKEEAANLYENLSRLLYSPLGFLESLRVTPEMEIQYKANIVAKNKNMAEINPPEQFKEFIDVDKLTSSNLGDYKLTFFLMRDSLEKSKNNRNISIPQNVIEELSGSLQRLDGLLENYICFQKNDLRKFKNREQEEGRIKRLIETEYRNMLNMIRSNENVANFLQDLYKNSFYKIKLKLPDNLTDLVRLARENPEGQFGEGINHVLTRFISDIESEVGQIDFNPEYVVIYNIRKIISLYCLSSGEIQGNQAFNQVKSMLGDKFDDFVSNPDLDISLSENGLSLVLQSKGVEIELPISKKAPESIFEKQQVSRDSTLLEQQIEKVKDLRNSQTASEEKLKEEEKKLQTYLSEWQKKYAGEYELADNAIGMIKDISIIATGLKQREILSLMKSFTDKNFNIVRLPDDSQEVNEKNEEELIEYLEKNGIENPRARVNFIYSYRADYQWARDYFLQAKDAKTGNRVFIESPLQHNKLSRNIGMSKDIAEDAEMPKGTEYREMNVYFEGGDWRAIGPYLFVGEAKFQKAIEASKQTLHEVSYTEQQAGELIKQEYRRLFGREVVIVGEGDKEEQAIFHIDMFLTFLPNPPKKPTVLVGDQSMTSEILDGLTEAEFDTIEKQMTQSQISARDMMETQNKILISHDIGGGLKQFVQEIKTSPEQLELQKNLDAAAKWFQEKGFEVVRIPSAISNAQAKEIIDPREKNILQVGERADRNYNNGLLEVYMDEQGNLVKKFYMPTFGITAVEKKIIEKYNQLGYEVIPIEGLIPSARNLGVANCITSEYRSDF